MKHTFVVATKSGEKVGGEWLEKLRAIPGVQVRGATADQAVIVTDHRVLASVRAELGDDFLIEEQVRRMTESYPEPFCDPLADRRNAS